MADYWGIDFGGTKLRIGRIDPTTNRKVSIVLDKDISDISNNEDLFELVAMSRKMIVLLPSAQIQRLMVK